MRNKYILMGILLFIVMFSVGCGASEGSEETPSGNNEDYVVIPQYEEAGYSDELNVSVKVISNYSETDGELVKKDSMIMYAYAERTKKVVGLEGRISTLHKDGTMYYHSDKIPSYKDHPLFLIKP